MSQFNKLTMSEESFRVGEFFYNNNSNYVVIEKESLIPDEGLTCYTVRKCRKHRIKKENKTIVSEKLKKLNIPFKIVDPPIREDDYNLLSFFNGSESDFETLRQEIIQENKSFIGIMCPISGKKFHRILCELGIVINS